MREIATVLDAVINLKDNFSGTLQTVEKNIGGFSRTYKRTGRDIQRTGRGMQTFGGNMMRSVTLPVVGAATAMIKLGSDFDDQMSTVQAVTGATADELQSLRDQARELGKDTRYSATEAASAQENLARAGFSTNEIMESLPHNLNLATAGALDLATASEITASTIRGFQLETSDAERVSDVLAKTAAITKTNVAGLGESFSIVAPVASTLGLDLEEVSAATGILGDNAIEGSQAGNMLRRGLLNLSAPTKQQQKVIDDLNMSFFDSQGEMKSMVDIIGELERGMEGMTSQEQMDAMSTIFGAQAVSGWSALLNEGSEALEGVQGELEESAGFAQRFAEISEDSLAGSFRSLKSSISELMISFFELESGPIRDVVDRVTELVDKFSELDDEVKQQMILFAGVAAAIGPVIWILGKILSPIGKIISAFGKFAGAVKGKGLFAAILTPGVKVVLILAAIAGAVYLAIKYWDELKEGLARVGEAILDFLGITEEDLAGWIEFFQGIWERVKEIGGNIGESFGNLASTVGESIGRILETLAPVMDFLGPILGFIIQVFVGGIVTAFLTLGHIVAGVIEFIAGIIENLVVILSGIIDFLVGVFTGNWELAWSGVETIFSGIVGLLETAWNGLVDLLSAPVEAVVDILSTAFHEKADKIRETWGSIKEFLKHPIQGTVNLISKGAGWIGNKLGIGQNYAGTNYWRGGLTSIHERGGEIIDLPRGSRVYPHDKSVQMAKEEGRSQSGGKSISIAKLADQIIVREDADIDKIADTIVRRIEKAELNMA